ncbi:MAG: DUF1266 domain-containing protein [Catenulispora sp.]|nr:DUF1266 domain-containing protein [Catenulispora sp.]
MMMGNGGPVGLMDDGDRLFAALRNGDRDGYLTVLAGINVFMPSPRAQGDEVLAGTETGTGHVTYRENGAVCIDVSTDASLTQPCRPDVFYRWLMWDRAVRILEEHKFKWTMVVNRGTYMEFRITVPEAAKWLNRHPRAVKTWEELVTQVRFTRAEALDGPLARALACGAHLSYTNCMPWNSMMGEYVHYVARALSIRESWGIYSARDWRRQVDALLNTQRYEIVDVLLALRRKAVADGAQPADPTLLSRLAEEWCAANSADPSTAAEMYDVAHWVGMCESWLRRDNVLPADGVVWTQAVWDLGRAVNMARWGMQCGYCDRPTAEQIVLRAGQLCAETYSNWHELSTAYLLGRVIKMGRQDDVQACYAESLKTHLALANAETSPFRLLSLH